MWDALFGWIGRLLATAAAFIGGWAAKGNADGKQALKVTRKQLDIANRPEPGVDDVADWLSGGD